MSKLSHAPKSLTWLSSRTCRMAWLLYVSLKVVFISDCMVTLPSEFQSVKMCCGSVSDDLFVFIDGELRL